MNPGDPLSKIIFDNTSGSSAILSQFISHITTRASEEDWENRTKKALEFGLSELKQFQVVNHFIASLQESFPGFNSLTDLNTWVLEYEKEWASLPDKWTQILMELHTDPVLKISTHSQSESLKAVFHKLFKSRYKLKIFQTQSAPANEGELRSTADSSAGCAQQARPLSGLFQPSPCGVGFMACRIRQ